MTIVFWAWVAVAVLLALGEAVTGGFFVLPWAVGGAAAALLEAFHVGTDWQWIAFVVVSSAIFITVQRVLAGRR